MSYLEDLNIDYDGNIETNDMMFNRLSYVRKVLLNDEIDLKKNENEKLNKGKTVDDLEVGQIVLRKIPNLLRENKLYVYWEWLYYIVKKRFKGNYKIAYSERKGI
ncbi:hypothetical protein DMUE_0307 [Dictyocoela muelleri]|nr:hypothetical protein DMUE_0307 [Dictyocoela muelleri]